MTLESFYDITQERGPNPGRYAGGDEPASPQDGDGITLHIVTKAMAMVNDSGRLGTVSAWYCSLCRDVNGGEGPCEHKDALFAAVADDADELADSLDDAEMYHCLAGGGYAR